METSKLIFFLFADSPTLYSTFFLTYISNKFVLNLSLLFVSLPCNIKLCKNVNLSNVIDRFLHLENKMKFLSNVDNSLLAYSLLGVTNLVNKND